jgi:hypothetical protein
MVGLRFYTTLEGYVAGLSRRNMIFQKNYIDWIAQTFAFLRQGRFFLLISAEYRRFLVLRLCENAKAGHGQGIDVDHAWIPDE